MQPIENTAACFKKILIPVDDTFSFYPLVLKSLDFRNMENTTLYLLYARPRFSWRSLLPVKHHPSKEEVLITLSEIEEKIYKRLHNVTIEIRIDETRNMQRAIANIIEEKKIDIIAVGNIARNLLKLVLNGLKASVINNCVGHIVTTAYSSDQYRVIVVLNEPDISTEKMEFVIALAKKYESPVHIIIAEEHNEYGSKLLHAEAFYQLYKSIKKAGIEPTHKTLPLKELNDELFKYAAKINAGVILLNDKEKLLSGKANDAITKSKSYFLDGSQFFIFGHS